MLGHASAAMTLDTYADLFPDDLDAVAVSLDEHRAKALEPVKPAVDLSTLVNHLQLTAEQIGMLGELLAGDIPGTPASHCELK